MFWTFLFLYVIQKKLKYHISHFFFREIKSLHHLCSYSRYESLKLLTGRNKEWNKKSCLFGRIFFLIGAFPTLNSIYWHCAHQKSFTWWKYQYMKDIFVVWSNNQQNAQSYFWTECDIKPFVITNWKNLLILMLIILILMLFSEILVLTGGSIICM